MRRWKVTLLVLFLGNAGFWLFNETGAQAGFSIQLGPNSVPLQGAPESSSRDQALPIGLIGDVCRDPDAGLNAQIRKLGDSLRLSPESFRDPLSEGPAALFINTPYSMARKVNSRSEFARFSTTAVAAIGQQRFARSAQTQSRTAPSPVSRAPTKPKRLSQASFGVDIRPPST